MKFFKSIIPVAAVTAMMSPASLCGAELEFSYNTMDLEPQSYGYAKVEAYDVAIRIDDPVLVGTKVKGFYVPAGNVGTSDHTAWLSTELRLDKKVNKSDITSQTATVGDDGYLRVNFDEPYTITDKGVYVGYSMKVNELLDETDAYPVAVVEGTNPDGLYIHTSRSRLKWIDNSSLFGIVSAMTVVLEGDFSPNAAGVSTDDVVYLPVGKEGTIDAVVANSGSSPISSIGYTYKAGEITGSGTISLPSPIKAMYGAKGTVAIPVEAIPEVGTFDFSLTIDKVNGEVNAISEATCGAELEVLPFIPVNRPLVEEYTGFWCGYCPVGYVALETLRKEYDDAFIAAAYHNGDEISTVANELFPSYVEGFPSSFVNRGLNEVYPGDLGVEWPRLRKAVALAEIDASVEWADAEKKNLVATSTFRFVKDMNGADIKIGYILIADGLTDPEWAQSNYLSGNTALEGEYADLFVNGGSKVKGLVFNDVVLSSEGIHGVDGSVPADIKAETPYTHSFTFDTSSVRNLDGEPVIQNPDKLRVIAFVYDSYADEIFNSASSDYADGGSFSVIDSVGAGGAGVVATEYFDLQGRRISRPSSGLYMRAEKMSDGRNRVSKVIVK
ncbi:MAG: hypothetical protein K2L91_05205 [Duncaniella sp.]|nr:hypothetical protein [Duncaniella sp.]